MGTQSDGQFFLLFLPPDRPCMVVELLLAYGHHCAKASHNERGVSGAAVGTLANHVTTLRTKIKTWESGRAELPFPVC